MKLETTASTLEMQGAEDTSNFSIAVNAKAFQVLSSTLYKNKIGSVVRELSSNAMDSHAMAGKREVPFSIHLPNDFEPWFSVSDQGLGLSAEDIRTVFTVYFQSTKENTNDAVGAFGLGSKTPFSYTDSFTVTSTYGGFTTVYSAYLTPSGLPAISEMHKEESKEPNGVEIRMSVERKDYYTFEKETLDQLRFFKVKPILLNTSAVFQEHWKVLFEGENGRVCDYRSGIVVVQGGVGYSLDYDFTMKYCTPELTTFYTNIANKTVILEFNIGEIGVTASREGVEYTHRTCKVIAEKLALFKKELEDHVSASIAFIDNEWDQAVFLKTQPFYGSIFSAKFSFTKGSLNFATIDLPNTACKIGGKPRRMKVNNGNYSLHRNFSVEILKQDMMVLVIRDTSTRIDQRLRTLQNTVVYEISLLENQTKEDLKQKLLDKMHGFKNIVFASDIIPPKVVRTGLPVTYYKANNSHHVRSWEKMDGDLADLDDFVYLESHKLVLTEGHLFQQYLSAQLFVKDIPMCVAVNKATMLELKKNGLGTELSVFLAEKREELESIVNQDLRKRFKQQLMKNALNNSFSHYRTVGSTEWKRLEGNAFHSIVNYGKSELLTSEEVRICNFMDLDSEYSKYKERLYTRVSKLKKHLSQKYPMADMWTNLYNRSESLHKLVDYVKLVDSVSKT